jgi:ABC-2 type transport system permease protein
MEQQYNQWKAMRAIAGFSFKAMWRSPSSVIFSFAFPMIFILVFGFLGNNGGPAFKIAIEKGSDTANAFYDSLTHYRSVKIITGKTEQELQSDLNKGRMTGFLKIVKNTDTNAGAAYRIEFRATTASADQYPQFLNMLESLGNKIDASRYPGRKSYAQLDRRNMQITAVRDYKRIDFILPGQLGFSLLSVGVFGVAFLFFNLRNTLVLKRFFATPIQRPYIVFGEGIARVSFQMITAVVILLAGYFFFGFTLVHGWITLLELLALSFIGLTVFMGFGFIVSSVAKTESTIPPFANLITLPQFLLSGTFFTIDAFPKWLQPFCKALPLTHLNNAMRKVAFEGANLWEVKLEIGMLLLWGIFAYAIAIKIFKWE